MGDEIKCDVQNSEYLSSPLRNSRFLDQNPPLARCDLQLLLPPVPNQCPLPFFSAAVSAGIVAFLSAVFCSAAAFSLASLTSPFSVHALEQVGNNDVFGELRKVSEEKGTPHEVLHDEITVT
jgi:hypothetical protein